MVVHREHACTSSSSESNWIDPELDPFLRRFEAVYGRDLNRLELYDELERQLSRSLLLLSPLPD